MKLLITHRSCPDGTTALLLLESWCQKRESEYAAMPQDYRFEDLNRLVDGDVHPIGPDADVIDVFSLADVEHIIFADICPTPELLEALLAMVPVTVLDHHKSAVERVEEAMPSWPQLWKDRFEAVFDMDRSGACITWDWLAETQGIEYLNRRLLVDYVQDKDLWKFELPHSKQIGYVINATELTVAGFTDLSHRMNDDLEGMIDVGEWIGANNRKMMHQLAEGARTFTIGGHEVRAAPSPYAIGSEFAGIMAEEDEAQFAGYYADYEDGRKWGLRSTENGPDVSAIAEVIAAEPLGVNGGGHYHAAGFFVKWGHPLATEGSDS